MTGTRRLLTIAAACLLALATAPVKGGDDMPRRWPAAKARQWYDKQPWLVGCNFLPSTAVNDVEMWQEKTFDAETIDRELGWAEKAGLNSVRVFLNYVVWRAGADGLKKRFDRFLSIAAKHRITVMPVLFDDCAFAGREPRVGKQPDPVPGVHNSQWVPSPGLKRVSDQKTWGDLEKYVADMVRTFGRDERVIVWDLYNEPGNSRMGDRSLPLMEAAFAWARRAQPRQPLTVAAWRDFGGAMSRRMMDLSDVISFHGYDPPAGIRAKLDACARHGRPILCTEWLRRQAGNTFTAILPLFRERKIGCYHWGLVAGRTQTYLHWGSRKGSAAPKVWQHDLFHKDGRPFRPAEVELLRKMTAPARPIDFAAIASPILFRGDAATAYRDPAAIYHDGVFHLYFTLVKIEDGKPYSYTAWSKSRDLTHWTKPRIFTPKDRRLNYSSPGNVIRFGDEWILCLQTYPRPRGEKYGNATARIWVMRSKDLEHWSEPELLRVKGPDVPVEKMGRMIDPYLIEDKDEPGTWWCFYKQNGVSRSRSRDLRTWTFAGRARAGENVCLLVQGGQYVMFHSPRNGVGIKCSADLKTWKDLGVTTLGQKDWPWAEGRLTAGFVADLRKEPRVGRYVMFFHGSAHPENDPRGGFDNHASLAIAWSEDLKTWHWSGKRPEPE